LIRSVFQLCYYHTNFPIISYITQLFNCNNLFKADLPPESPHTPDGWMMSGEILNQ